MVATPSYQQMTDNGDGTYTAQFLSNVEGYVTVIAYLYTQGKIRVDWYDSTVFEVPYEYQEDWTQVVQDWNTGNLYLTKQDYATAKIYFLLKAPYTQTYTFTLVSNDGSALYVDNIIQISNASLTCD